MVLWARCLEECPAVHLTPQTAQIPQVTAAMIDIAIRTTIPMTTAKHPRVWTLGMWEAGIHPLLTRALPIWMIQGQGKVEDDQARRVTAQSAVLDLNQLKVLRMMSELSQLNPYLMMGQKTCQNFIHLCLKLKIILRLGRLRDHDRFESLVISLPEQCRIISWEWL
jgi:hypothetical protein